MRSGAARPASLALRQRDMGWNIWDVMDDANNSFPSLRSSPPSRTSSPASSSAASTGSRAAKRRPSSSRWCGATPRARLGSSGRRGV